MSGNNTTPRLARALLTILILLLALSLTIVSVYYQRPDRTLCRGLLGAGFPLPVVCDASGESPPSSWGRIDWADLDSLNLIGGVSDLVLYGMTLWGAALLWQRERERRSRTNNGGY